MKVALVTDAWHPQVNGVVRTLDATINILRQWGHQVMVISPDQFRSLPAPGYSEIRLAFTRPQSIGKRILEFGADAVHIATEGPLGLSARRWCSKNGCCFTTAYHTQFPEYLAKRTKLPPRCFWPYIRWFHRRSRVVMTSTDSIRRQLQGQGIMQVYHWGRGVDLDHFSPSAPLPPIYERMARPIQIYVGRVSVEKNIEAFLQTDQPGSKIVVGDGPALTSLAARYPDVPFVGRKSGRELAGFYAGADIFVFPSKTDTFGLVVIEALACGTPVAAYPVTGPIDILTARCGRMADDLNLAIDQALQLEPSDCLQRAQQFNWLTSAQQFINGLAPMEPHSAA